MDWDGIGTSVQSLPLATVDDREPLAYHEALVMVKIRGGSFLMGSPSEPGRCWDEGPQHQVTLESFYLSQTPVTQVQWRLVAGWEPVERALHPDPSHFKGAHRPVEQVSWHGAREFCLRLSRRSGKHYVLPGEAQWEYACRAGTTAPFHCGATLTSQQANFDAPDTDARGLIGRSRAMTTDVCRFAANAFGLYDMHGNVWEWCADLWHSSYINAPVHGQPWLDADLPQDSGQLRVMRGGSWDSSPRHCRSAYRNNAPASLAEASIGFRVCRLPGTPQTQWPLD